MDEDDSTPDPLPSPPPRPREWLLANGLGGYALGPSAGPPFRGYHGWLVAAVQPPDGRVLLVGPVEAAVRAADEHGAPATRLAGLDLCPGSASAPGGVRIRLDAAMTPGANATTLTWTNDGAGVVDLAVEPLLAGRDHHPGAAGSAAPARVEVAADGTAAVVGWVPPIPELRLRADRGAFAVQRREVAIEYPEERERGTGTGETLDAPLRLEATLAAGESLSLVLSTAAGGTAPAPDPVAVRTAPPGGLEDAAGRFLVHRRDARSVDPDEGVTVIAGYPWFGDWGRDTFISLPGLALATGRHGIAARILRTWAGLVRDGLLPNHFPGAGGEPAYHAIDAPLWFVRALAAREAATGDQEGLVAALRPAWEGILDAYAEGTRFGIRVADDGLVTGGEPGLQLTWMDARVDGVVITPRRGKPVEIQALWVAGTEWAARWLEAAGEAVNARRWREHGRRARASFAERFPRADARWLHDVVDGPDGDDGTLRPNQLLALSLVPDLVPTDLARSVVNAAEAHLVVPGGVRTLAPFEPGYRPRFQGPPAARDAAYHQGAAWTWLLGAWLDAVELVRGVEAARDELRRHVDALDPDGTGGIPELLEPEPPFAARGCPWQAWGTAELLRVQRRLQDGPARGLRRP